MTTAEILLTILCWFAFFVGLIAIGLLVALVVRAIENKRKRKGELIYLYSEHYNVKGGDDSGIYFHY